MAEAAGVVGVGLEPRISVAFSGSIIACCVPASELVGNAIR